MEGFEVKKFGGGYWMGLLRLPVGPLPGAAMQVPVPNKFIIQFAEFKKHIVVAHDMDRTP